MRQIVRAPRERDRARRVLLLRIERMQAHDVVGDVLQRADDRLVVVLDRLVVARRRDAQLRAQPAALEDRQRERGAGRPAAVHRAQERRERRADREAAERRDQVDVRIERGLRDVDAARLRRRPYQRAATMSAGGRAARRAARTAGRRSRRARASAARARRPRPAPCPRARRAGDGRAGSPLHTSRSAANNRAAAPRPGSPRVACRCPRAGACAPVRRARSGARRSRARCRGARSSSRNRRTRARRSPRARAARHARRPRGRAPRRARARRCACPCPTDRGGTTGSACPCCSTCRRSRAGPGRNRRCPASAGASATGCRSTAAAPRRARCARATAPRARGPARRRAKGCRRATRRSTNRAADRDTRATSRPRASRRRARPPRSPRPRRATPDRPACLAVQHRPCLRIRPLLMRLQEPRVQASLSLPETARFSPFRIKMSRCDYIFLRIAE
ncbi:hypothetical protein DP49_6999 [Burkholderia pseudomallei]|nr:hypothetical protein DP49_6999 [Burkholderia pseudomallei]